eukprot:TRINITY_DN7768_c0_g4_i1.p1 TRINITY_DN7768_c0_g4~~TRINITY_DN7768_c0_g4_i1.p1  ORF type:complete len:381 (-),score=69.37 TRINITY_DN7768_c0_g4_i1:401-1543(-)
MKIIQDDLCEALSLEREQHRLDVEALQERLNEAELCVARAGSPMRKVISNREQPAGSSPRSARTYVFHRKSVQPNFGHQRSERLAFRSLKSEKPVDRQLTAKQCWQTFVWLRGQLSYQLERVKDLEQECAQLRKQIDDMSMKSVSAQEEAERQCAQLRKQIDDMSKKTVSAQEEARKSVAKMECEYAKLVDKAQCLNHVCARNLKPLTSELVRLASEPEKTDLAQLQRLSMEFQEEAAERIVDLQRSHATLKRRVSGARRSSLVSTATTECVSEIADLGQAASEFGSEVADSEKERTSTNANVNTVTQAIATSSAIADASLEKELQAIREELKVTKQDHANKMWQMQQERAAMILLVAESQASSGFVPWASSGVRDFFGW